ncbi:MAG: poly-gamma-glutamate biosynthesis protein PgsC/CapC [Synergistaceae bacterium]|nr:poly-gamma-glutamate biosynthesis protein PgsC/CapC [Synergistaceae bacterium]
MQTQLLTSEIPLALGILAGLYWSRRTGWNCGGLITPGLLAQHSDLPTMCFCSILAGVALAPVLHILTQRWHLYGRERVGVSMLLALSLRPLLVFALPPEFVPAFWLGWVIPGLIAADVERQGLCITLAGIVAPAAAASFASSLLFDLWTFLSLSPLPLSSLSWKF